MRTKLLLILIVFTVLTQLCTASAFAVSNGEKNKDSILQEQCTDRNAPPEGRGSNVPRQTRPNRDLRKIKDDAPSWAKQERPTMADKSGETFARRILDTKYGPGQYRTGPGSEFSQIKKWAQTHFIW